MDIGIVISTKEELNNLLNSLSTNCDYYEATHLKDDVVLMKMRENNFYFYVSGIGQLNATIACSKLNNQFGCKMVYSIGTCKQLIVKNQYDVGSIIEFKNNILNLGFKIKPRKFHYDNANVSDYMDVLSPRYNLLLTSDNVKEENITFTPHLKLNRYDDVFIDTEAYGVLSYSVKNDISFRIIKVVVEDIFDVNFLDDIVYNNLYNYLKNVFI